MPKLQSPVRALREQAGLSRRDLAVALRVTPQRISQLETTAPIPAALGLALMDMFAAEAAAIGLTLDTLLRHRRVYQSGGIRRAGRGPAAEAPPA